MFHGNDVRLRRPVALRVLHPALVDEPVARERFGVRDGPARRLAPRAHRAALRLGVAARTHDIAMVLGTVHYMSPELTMGGTAAAASDLYSSASSSTSSSRGAGRSKRIAPPITAYAIGSSRKTVPADDDSGNRVGDHLLTPFRLQPRSNAPVYRSAQLAVIDVPPAPALRTRPAPVYWSREPVRRAYSQRDLVIASLVRCPGRGTGDRRSV
jgi:serine/threonine protein kinase